MRSIVCDADGLIKMQKAGLLALRPLIRTEHYHAARVDLAAMERK